MPAYRPESIPEIPAPVRPLTSEEAEAARGAAAFAALLQHPAPERMGAEEWRGLFDPLFGAAGGGAPGPASRC